MSVIQIPPHFKGREIGITLKGRGLGNYFFGLKSEGLATPTNSSKPEQTLLFEGCGLQGASPLRCLTGAFILPTFIFLKLARHCSTANYFGMSSDEVAQANFMKIPSEKQSRPTIGKLMTKIQYSSHRKSQVLCSQHFEASVLSLFRSNFNKEFAEP